jgi:tRNA 5-methylaminomethyl-2-thiouridine biosynthesis bifunctional protein
MTPAPPLELRPSWADRGQWRIVQWGFGDGSDFLDAWQAWRDDPQRPRLLHCTWLEPSPVDASAWLATAGSASGRHAGLIEELRAQWWGLLPGVHRLTFDQGRVLLTLCIGDPWRSLENVGTADVMKIATAALPCESRGLFKALAKRCRRGTTLFMDRRLSDRTDELRGAGFVPMVPPVDAGPAASGADPACAIFDPHWEGRAETPTTPPSRAVVIGAGLAGAAAAASLARRGWQVDVLDAADVPAAGASGLPAGLLAPHTSHDDNLLSRLSRCGVRMTLAQCRMFLQAGTDWEQTGVLERRGDDARPLPSLGEHQDPWQQPTGSEPNAVWHDAGAWVRPAALASAWLRQPGVRWRGGNQVRRLARDGSEWLVFGADDQVVASAPLVVVAASLSSAALVGGRVSLHAVRGQVSLGHNAGLELPRAPLNGNGHFLPNVPLGPEQQRSWLSGSTYVRGDTACEERAAEHRANLSRIKSLAPEVATQLEPAFERGTVRGWTGVRCASSDRRPLMGELEHGLWISTAMGSRGLTFAALCAELMCAQLHAEPLPLDTKLAKSLSARRQI